MNWFKAAFLVAVLIATSGFRCFLFCTDQTSIQSDYVEQRDRCRDYAQTKIDLAMHENNGEEKNRKTQLVSLFSDCMAKNGWTVPNGKDEGSTKPAAGAPVAPAAPMTAPAVAATNAAEGKSALSRSAECAFARQNADVSSIAAARAKACDLECEQRRAAAPEAPNPAACPAQSPSMYEHGAERP